MSLYPLIIKTLHAAPMSLSDLQAVAQVSLPTLRKAIQELTDHRWIRVVGQSEANGGRPAMLFGIDDSYYVMVGVHMQLPGIRMILTDMVGNVLDEHEVFSGIQPSPQQVIHAITEHVLNVQDRFSDRRVLGIGIAAPGFTDPGSGDIISIGRVSGWENFPVCQRLHTSLDLAVHIANDIDCMALAEFRHTDRPLEGNLVYFGFDEAVKASLFLNGRLYKGSLGNAGLIMSQFLRIPGDEASLEDQKHMLTIQGLNTVLERELSALLPTERVRYEPLLAAGYRERFMAVFRGAEDGLLVCQRLTQALYTVLSVAIAEVICMIQPDTVVIGGLLSGIPDPAFKTLTDEIRKHLPTLFSNRVYIAQGGMVSPNTAALGATYHFMERYLVADTFSGSHALVRS